MIWTNYRNHRSLTAAAALVMGGCLALTGCTSSGSAGPTTGPTTTSASSTNTTTKSAAPANPLVFGHLRLSSKQVTRIETIVQRAPGVASTNYQNNSFQVYLSKSSTSKERVIVERVVQQQLTAFKSASKGKTHH